MCTEATLFFESFVKVRVVMLYFTPFSSKAKHIGASQSRSAKETWPKSKLPTVEDEFHE